MALSSTKKRSTQTVRALHVDTTQAATSLSRHQPLQVEAYAIALAQGARAVGLGACSGDDGGTLAVVGDGDVLAGGDVVVKIPNKTNNNNKPAATTTTTTTTTATTAVGVAGGSGGPGVPPFCPIPAVKARLVAASAPPCSCHLRN